MYVESPVGDVGSLVGEVPEDEGDDEVGEEFGERLDTHDEELHGPADADEVAALVAHDVFLTKVVAGHLHHVQPQTHQERHLYQNQLSPLLPQKHELTLHQRGLSRRGHHVFPPRVAFRGLTAVLVAEEQEGQFEHHQHQRAQALVVLAGDDAGDGEGGNREGRHQAGHGDHPEDDFETPVWGGGT